MKRCFKCGRLLSLDCFYKHSKMKDGHLNKCIECTKKDVKVNRLKNIERIRAYDRNRPNKAIRNQKNLLAQKTPKGKAAHTKALAKYRAKYPEKRKAHNIFSNAMRNGEIKPQPCEVCGCLKTEAHHFDYSKPLEVIWLCPKHHKQRHAMLRVFDRIPF